jgi:adenine-specific DNA methylase
MKLMGIFGDPVAGRKMVDEVIAGIRKERVKDPYGYPRAFTYTPSDEQRLRLRETMRDIWGEDTPTVLDSFAGGGSIPFEAYRLGFNVIAGELNPVACVIERATLEYPAKFGIGLGKDISRWGNAVAEQVKKVLGDCFPRNPGETDLCYIWVRTVACPDCRLTVPLSPNWWLDTTNKLGYELIVPMDKKASECTFKVSKLREKGFDPDAGSVAGGKGKCPRCPAVLDGDFIKGEAQAGRMGWQIAAIGYKTKGTRGRHFREVTTEDLEGVRRAETLLKKRLPEWERQGLVPIEEYPQVSNDPRPLYYGMTRWRDFFSPRQLLVHLTTLEAIKSLPLEEELGAEKAKAVLVFLSMAFGKCLNYDSVLSNWHPTRVVVANTFDRHDYAFSWSPGEIDGASQLWEFGLEQVLDSYLGIAELLPSKGKTKLTFLQGNAASLPSVRDGSVQVVVIDPPYSTNVMYAELADFFYVWMKRILGDTYPELFKTPLTDKENEAVANVARFKGFETKASELAEKDYEEKMLAAFKELHRVLRNDGVLTVMFTHKKSEAWDALAKGLIDAGFEITASWPVRTESEYSLNQAKKTAAASTILLVCRKRPTVAGTRGWWEDLQPLVRDTAYTKAQEYSNRGIHGVDLLLATYGPALQILSSRWPVVDNKGNEVRPDAALREASKAVSDFRFKSLTTQKLANVDMPTRFCIHAWDFYQAREFPADAAIKLGHALGVDIEDLMKRYGVLKKKGDYVVLQGPEDRRRAKRFKVDGEGSYNITLDKIHAAMLTYEDKGARGVKQLYQNTGFLAEKEYVAAFEALLNALPPNTSEYETLKNVAEYAMEGKVKDRREHPRRMVSKRLGDFKDEGEGETE